MGFLERDLILDELFGGIGGFSEAARITEGFTVRNYVDIDPDAQAVYRHHHPGVKIHGDIRTYHPDGQSDVYTIGFPCTGTSSAGTRTGLNHAESGFWFEALRCVIEGRPNFMVIENPEGLVHRGLREVLGGLRMAGYTWDDPQLISAAWLGAPHRRDRLFVVAYSNELLGRFRAVPTCWAEQIRAGTEACGNPPSYSSSQGREGNSRNREQINHGTDTAVLERVGQNESLCSGVDDGVPPWLCGKRFDGWWRDNPAPYYPAGLFHPLKDVNCQVSSE